jgi:hypothetical protein
MSSTTARTALKAALAAGFPALPQYDTLGVRINNESLEDLWATTDFIPLADAAISLGAQACYRESGTFRVYVVARAGAGDAAAIAQADEIAAYFRRWRDTATQTRVLSNVPPAPSEQSDGRWLVVAVDMLFSRDYFV